jgi:hypothetical protein
MKKLLFIPLIVLAFMAQAQTIFTLVPNCKQVVTVGPADTAYISAMLSTSDGFGQLLFSQLSGPSTALLAGQLVAWQSGLQATAQVPVTKLMPGTYVFTVTGKSVKGSIGTTLDSLVVMAPPVPVPPRTVSSFSMKLVNGVWVPSFAYSDGSTQ